MILNFVVVLSHDYEDSTSCFLYLAYRSLDSSVAKLRQELPSKKPRKFGNFGNSTGSSTYAGNAVTKKKVFMVIGINTAFSGRRRRDSIRETWMPRGASFVHD